MHGASCLAACIPCKLFQIISKNGTWDTRYLLTFFAGNIVHLRLLKNTFRYIGCQEYLREMKVPGVLEIENSNKKPKDLKNSNFLYAM